MNDLTSAEAILSKAKLPDEIFGVPPGSPTRDELFAHVESEWKRLAVMLHPDKFPGDPERSLATELFSKLGAFKAAAGMAIDDGVYGKIRAPSVPAPKTDFPITIATKTEKYELTGLLRAGSIADVYECGDKAVKVARNSADNDLLDNEAKVLRELYPLAQPDVQYFRHLPKLYDSFSLKGKTGAARKANVLAKTPGMISLADVFKAYPQGLDFRDVAWMWKRCLMALGFIHRKGFVHGAVNIDHVLVHPIEHGARIIDWTCAVKAGDVIKSADKESIRIAPPELMNKQQAHFGTDIWMLSRTIQGLLNKEAPAQIKSFLRGCLIANIRLRPADAWALHDELKELLEVLVGPPKYRLLEMPAQ